MKFLYAVMLLVFLASCTKTPVVTPTETPTTPEVTQETPVDEALVDDIVSEIEELGVTAENEIITLDGAYKNPKGDVDMKIDYSVDASGVIQSINVSATTYDLTQFNTSAQELVGKTLTDAESFYVAGGSLTSDAFTTAIKNR